jgi:tetratricopeptide (TPR) repeat protein
MTNEHSKVESLGDYEYDCKNYQAAYDYYKQAVELNPESAYAWFRRSMCANKLNNAQEFINGIAKAKDLADSELKNRIEFEFYTEMIHIFNMSVELALENISPGYGPQRDVLLFKEAEDAGSSAVELAKLAPEIIAKFKNKEIDFNSTFRLTKSIYSKLKIIYGFDANEFKPAELTWKNKMGTLVQKMNNLAAWINYQVEINGLKDDSKETGIKAKFV